MNKKTLFYLSLSVVSVVVVFGNLICLTTPYCPNPNYDAQWYKVALAVLMFAYFVRQSAQQ